MAESKSPLSLFLVVISCLFLAAICVGCTGTAETPKNTLTGDLFIPASTALAPTLQAQSQAFTTLNPGVKINVTSVAAGEAIWDVINGQTDIAGAARAPNDKEYGQAKNAGKSLHMTAVGYDGLAIVVNSQNPVTGISSDQVRQIFIYGNVTDWKQIPGSGKTGLIHIYVLDPKVSNTADAFISKLATGASFTPTATVLPGTSSEPLSQKILTDPDGITFAATTFVYPNMKTLPVDGISPSPATMQDGTYLFSRKLYIITDGAPQGINKEFINFIFSQDGQKIATDKGIVPVS
jgi:phosphate transport system substrate-binding protein